jgi:hypothetical protein
MKLKQSNNWGLQMSLQQVIENASFAFIGDIDRKRRPFIVLRQPFEGINCIGIDVDKYGVVENSVMEFSHSVGDGIEDLGANVSVFIADWLRSMGEHSSIED